MAMPCTSGDGRMVPEDNRTAEFERYAPIGSWICPASIRSTAASMTPHRWKLDTPTSVPAYCLMSSFDVLRARVSQLREPRDQDGSFKHSRGHPPLPWSNIAPNLLTWFAGTKVVPSGGGC